MTMTMVCVLLPPHTLWDLNQQLFSKILFFDQDLISLIVQPKNLGVLLRKIY